MKNRDKLLWRKWRSNIGQCFRCVHTGRTGKVVQVYWRNRERTGGDWGVFVVVQDADGQFTSRPAFLEPVSEVAA